MLKEAIAVPLRINVYFDLMEQLRKLGDDRDPGEIVGVAVRHWLAANGCSRQRGYQWKELFLPDGAELRLRFQGVDYFATVEGDRLMYAGENVSPRQFALMVTGTNRNAWRDIWIRRAVNEYWVQACRWRSRYSATWPSRFIDRRRLVRRSGDL
ncbi:hypothetical protein IP92_01573 [Pseudoduganella flava]|uniref:Uncharacterized protein n=1 Tax=Pseudoduganella flava TaxID=871742 RepID=A0A562Q113_9BURK|nr:hypothetical protein [Pseudoduganella flava]QGZ38139.1 hypothetical protein GO485_03130 [Pseudoduganella flava]TWI50344.1 hypothetical protein IP92_01573 [Pseudoduganella flava]